MTFTVTTIKKLRAIGLDQATVDKVLEIFEEARLAKPQKKGCAADRAARGTRLQEDWVLPVEWREWAVRLGLRPHEADREARGFKSYWLNVAGPRGLKLKWNLTWQTWCRRMLERAGRPMNDPDAVPNGGSGSQGGPSGFTSETWQAIAKRHKAGAPWSPDWGPAPDRMDCQMPAEYL